MPMHVHEIFNSKGLAKHKSGRHDKEPKEQVQFLKKTTMAPLPPMSKFGGYKPKILAEEQITPTENHNISSVKSTPAPVPPRPVPQLTKPKPFIIGDKDVPMMLSSADDYNDNREEAEKKMENLNLQDNSDDLHNGFDNLSFRRESDVYNQNGIDENNYDELEHKASMHNETHSDKPLTNDHFDNQPVPPIRPKLSITMLPPEDNTHAQTEMEELFIPLPDYEEDERTMTFDEEDPDDHIQRTMNANEKAVRPATSVSAIKEYHGADLSHFLEDDDDDVPVEPPSGGRRKSKGGTFPMREDRPKQRHTMFKPRNNNTNRRKSLDKSKQTGTNFRTFSYADSKIGTKGKGSNKHHTKHSPDFSDDSDLFVNANNRDGTYESFLHIRNGGEMPSPQSYDNGVDMNDWRKKMPDNKFWKKLTVRLKHKMQKGGY